MKISSLDLSEYSAIREYKRHKEYFLTTLVDPGSFGEDMFSNKRKFIITGKKGSGKTTYCLYLSDKLAKLGYGSEFLIFNDEITLDDVRDIVAVQHMNLQELASTNQLYGGVSSLYEFWEIWKRKGVFSACRSLSSKERRTTSPPSFAATSASRVG